MLTLVNMKVQDVNENGYSDSCYIDGYLCSVLFFDVFLCFFPDRAAHSKSAMIVVFFTVKTLRVLEVHSRCVCSREAHSEHTF